MRKDYSTGGDLCLAIANVRSGRMQVVNLSCCNHRAFRGLKCFNLSIYVN